MTRASALCFFLGAGALLSACDIPPATFSDTTTSGSGGAGSGGAPMSTASGGSGGTGGSVMLPQVPCKSSGELCMANEICCFHVTTALKDHCSAASVGCCPVDDATCVEADDYLHFACNGLEDCPGEKCCAGFIAGELSSSYCAADCSAADQLLMCKSNEGECGPGSSCQPILSGYPGYSVCSK